MSTTELKSMLHESINNIEDVKFLEAMKTILYSKYKLTEEQELSDEQKKRIKESKEQVRKGNFRSNKDVFNSVDEWLNK